MFARERRWVEAQEEMARSMGVTHEGPNVQAEHRRCWVKFGLPFSQRRSGEDEPPDADYG